jgi:hypothetical protein
MDDMSPVCELGSGTCGHVIKMKHNMSGMMMAVKVKKIEHNNYRDKFLKFIINPFFLKQKSKCDFLALLKKTSALLWTWMLF